MKALFRRVIAVATAVVFLQWALFNIFYFHLYFFVYEDYYSKSSHAFYHYVAEDLISGRVDEDALSKRLDMEIATKKLAEPLETDAKTVLLRENQAGDGYEIIVHLPEAQQSVHFTLPPYPNYDSQFFIWTTLILALVSVALLYGVLQPYRRELLMIESVAKRLAAGEWKARIPKTQGEGVLALTSAFNAMANQVMAMILGQRHLLHAVSHELRTPLARIQMGMALMAHKDDAQARQQRLSILDDEVDKMQLLVDELLQFARIESAPYSAIQMQPLNLAQELEDVIRRYAPEFRAKGVEIQWQAIGVDHVVWSPILFRRVIDNLLSNAGRHAQSQIRVQVDLMGETLKLRVEDDGPGIPQADRTRVLDPFIRLGTPSGREGHGLGLAIVAAIAKRQGGRIEIGDSPLGGCQMDLTLELKVEVESPMLQSADQNPAQNECEGL